MFSESYDAYIDDIKELKEWGNNAWHVEQWKRGAPTTENGKHAGWNNTETVSQTPETKTLESKVKDQINKRVNYLTYNDPNNHNWEKKKYSFGEMFSEVAESEIWQIAEKKIPWFERTLPNWCKAKVVCSDDHFSLNITKESITWKKEYLNINLTDFQDNENNVQNNGQDKKENAMPKMTITWNIKLLDNNLNWWMSEKPVWDNINLSIWDQYDIVRILQSIEENVMRFEREEVDAHEDKRQQQNKEAIDREQEEYRLLLIEISKEMNSEPPETYEKIADYMINSRNFNSGWEYLSARRTFLALCIMLQSVGNINEVKDIILENEETNIQRTANTKNIEWWEHIVEYLQNNPTDLQILIDNKSKIISYVLENDCINSLDWGTKKNDILNLLNN